MARDLLGEYGSFAALRGGVCSGRFVLGAILVAGYGSNG
jgi:hypothetical protein